MLACADVIHIYTVYIYSDTGDELCIISSAQYYDKTSSAFKLVLMFTLTSDVTLFLITSTFIHSVLHFKVSFKPPQELLI